MPPAPGDLPNLKATLRQVGSNGNSNTQLYDVQFYPYTAPGKDPVFAVAGGPHIFICRPVRGKLGGIEIIREFKDEADIALSSIAWSQDSRTGDALICAGGDRPRCIKIFNVRTGKLVRQLKGHGEGINCLVTSPISPHILASAADDHAIRLWNLEPEYKKQPCSAIMSGKEGHRQGILSICFHHSGKYLVSGSLDTSIKLWVVPKLPDENTGSDKVNIIHYPHFSSTEIHTDYVDCIRFYGDLIISKSAKENQILLWKIDGFNSSSPPPPISMSAQNAPMNPSNTAEDSTAHGSTYSAFGTRFQRLLTFALPFTQLFYMRFGLFHMPDKHPILVAGNEKSRLFWWDLQRLEEASAEPHKDDGHGSGTRKRKRVDHSGPGLGLGRDNANRESSITSNASSSGAVSSSAPSNHSGERDKRFDISNPFQLIPAHKQIVVPKVTFATRQVAWSTGGEWAVAVGDHGMVCLFGRWE
ncbi:uncharacterized protein K452DRAFT_311456 [Aplosporella prunicola CBS 121167]|uniref:Uncharacterized protein n=1 Tax=Aplosporella prunicola CBS 121167 TaxID=1176127 RepID=A0A6A6B4F7_9PEZI|nr:uncharacterized protein K452DRAFT_311456 [Aplosporella prunicola CBS 121167]KAF2138518.1 hypothetical protein K452DRAFT_311456 [Aplosporella prunicola CBS 121167]